MRVERQPAGAFQRGDDVVHFQFATVVKVDARA
jgi:hypothetical protein